MRILVAGAGGALGLPLTRRLVETGCQVTGLTRSASKKTQIEQLGASALIADALDPGAVTAAVHHAKPTHLVNLLTALPPGGATRPRDLRPTNRLRVEGSRNLLAAARETGVRRVVVESFLAVYGFPLPGGQLDEQTPLGPIGANHPLYETVMALRSLEAQHQAARSKGITESVILRFGMLYGPGVSSTESMLRNLIAGRMWLPAKTAGAVSWIHLDDAVSAVVAAVLHESPGGLYNVADSQPMALGQAVEVACQSFNAPPPRALPTWLLRWLAPVVASMTTAHWALNNRRARLELGWHPAAPTLREGFGRLAAAYPPRGLRRG